MRKLHFWSTLAASLVTFTATCQAATLPVTSDLLIQLDGTDVTLDSGGVQNWNNQVPAAGVPASFDAVLATNRPTLLPSQPMPNGSFHNTVSFIKGGTGTSNPGLTNPDYLVAGASSGFDSLRTLTMFSVFKVNSVAPAGNSAATATAAGQKEQVIFASRHTTTAPSSTIAWSHTFEDDVNGDTAGSPPAITPQFRQTGNLSQNITDAELAPASVAANTWYVVASRWNGTINPVNGQPAWTSTSVVVTPGALPNTIETATVSATATAEGVWSTHEAFAIGKNTAATGGSSTRGFLDGQIAEILVYGDTLTEADFNAVTGYLARKYLIPEPSSICLAAAMALLGITYLRRRTGKA